MAVTIYGPLEHRIVKFRAFIATTTRPIDVLRKAEARPFDVAYSCVARIPLTVLRFISAADFFHQ